MWPAAALLANLCSPLDKQVLRHYMQRLITSLLIDLPWMHGCSSAALLISSWLTSDYLIFTAILQLQQLHVLTIVIETKLKLKGCDLLEGIHAIDD